MADHLIPVRSDGKWGYFSTAARKLVLPLQYDSAEAFHDGRAWVSDGRQFGCIDTQGNLTPVQKFDSVGPFGNGFAPFNQGSIQKFSAHDNEYYQTGGKWGFVNTAGAIAVPAQYDGVVGFSEGLAFLQNDEPGVGPWMDTRSRCVDAAFKTLFEIELSVLYGFSEGRTVVHRRLEKFHWIDRNGREIGKPYDICWSFTEGLAGALINSGYRHVFVDLDGKEVLQAPENLNGIGAFREGLCWGLTGQPRDFGNGRWYGANSGPVGFFDRSGKWAIKPAFESARDFHDGRAAVSLHGKWGFINTSGRIVVPLQWDKVRDFVGGVAVVEGDGRFEVIDTKGSTLWKAKSPP